MESVILTVRQLLIDGKAKIEGSGSYSESAAREAFERVARQHGWTGTRFLGQKPVVLIGGIVLAVSLVILVVVLLV